MPALRVGLSQLIANLSVSIPGIICRKLIGSSVSTESDFNDALAGYNVLFRWAQVTNSVVIAITMGYLPAASYSYQAKDGKRWFALTAHSLWIAIVWGALSCILTWGMPKQIALIFAKQPGYLKWAEPMLRNGNGLAVLIFSRFNFPAMLQSMGMGITSTFVSLSCQLVSILGFALLLYYTNKHDPIRLCWCYSLSYAFGFVFGGIVLAFPIYKFWKQTRDKNINTNKEENDKNTSSQNKIMLLQDVPASHELSDNSEVSDEIRVAAEL